MADRNDLQATLQRGIAAARQGDKSAARRLLQEVIRADARNELAWLWMASVVSGAEQRRRCLNKVLEINPDNERAKEALRRLETVSAEQERSDQERDAVTQLRQIQRRRAEERDARPEKASSGGAVLALMLLGIIIVVAAGVVTTGIVFQDDDGGGGAAVASATVLEVAVLESSTPTATRTPRPTVDLPATFTPTPTNTPTNTPTPAPTAIPLEAYNLFYSRAERGNAGSGLYSTQADGSATTLLGEPEDGFEDFAFSPDGQQIAFVRTFRHTARRDSGAETVTGPELFVAPADDLSAAQQITDFGPERLSSPTWSPDGAQVAFSSDADGDMEIFLILANGNNLRQLTRNIGQDSDPAWSPDGNLLVFASDANSPGLPELHTIPPNGGEIIQLTSATGSSFAPAWSPDGSEIIFISDRGGDNDVYIVASSGVGARLITQNDAGAEDREPGFSPDGRLILFGSKRERSTFQLYVFDRQLETVTRITDNGRDNLFAAFRPQ